MFLSQVRSVLLSMVAYKTASRLNSAMTTERCFGTVATVFVMTVRGATRAKARRWLPTQEHQGEWQKVLKQNNTDDDIKVFLVAQLTTSRLDKMMQTGLFSNVEGWCWGEHRVLLTLLPCHVLPWNSSNLTDQFTSSHLLARNNSRSLWCEARRLRS